MEHLYKVTAVDPVSSLEMQRSDPHTWPECESVYFSYVEDYPTAHILIVLVE